jgi:hypothetical protein
VPTRGAVFQFELDARRTVTLFGSRLRPPPTSSGRPARGRRRPGAAAK